MVWVVQAQSLEQEVPTLEQSLVLEVRSFSNAVIALSSTSLLTELLLNM